MVLLECFDIYDDSQIKKLFGGKSIEIKYMDGATKSGVVTNFIGASIADCANRSIVGIILDDDEEIVISKEIIKNIRILN